MKINYKESQIDFLSHVSGASQEAHPPRYMAAQVSLSLENLVILSIVAIMLVIFSFSMGIERGKRVALAAQVTSGDVASAGATAAVSVPVVAGKVDKASEKAEAKDKVDPSKMKGFPVSSQTVAKAKSMPVVTDAVITVQAKTAALKAPTAGGYTLQVASYKGAQYAQREADKLKQKGFGDVYILAKGSYTIVCVGNFQKKEDASDVKRQLKGRYQDFVVRRL